MSVIGEGCAVVGCAGVELVEDTADGGQVADPACLQGVFQFGVGADHRDLQVVGPAGWSRARWRLRRAPPGAVGVAG